MADVDQVCKHGAAMDVHCCGCHSGFLFTPKECVCLAIGSACHICGKPATCLGVYEGRDDQPRLAACDDCCGHGNEDGWCVPIPGTRKRSSDTEAGIG